VVETETNLTKLAELLLEKEVIFKEDLLDLFGPRPWDKVKEDDSKQLDNSGDNK
jgi:cell division protease FtsH